MNMNKPILLLISITILFYSCHAQQRASFQPMAVVELFTSEGCSSCPPADKVLARYCLDSIYDGVKIFPLAFHVDYWDYLGWRDSFSSAQNSDRQRMYVEQLGLSGAYTPQMIVNGAVQFVGSDESALQAAISDVSKEKTTASFTQLNISSNVGRLKVQYALEGNIKDCEVHVALVSRQVSTAVKRGENTGRKLSHANVVREFVTTTANATGEVSLKNALNLPADNRTVIAYVQRSSDRHIIAAAEIR